MNKVWVHMTTKVWSDTEYPSMLYKYGCLFLARIDRVQLAVKIAAAVTPVCCVLNGTMRVQRPCAAHRGS